MRRIYLLLVLTLSFAAIPAAADSSVNVAMTGVGGANQGDVYVAPYYMSISGGPSIAVICDDYSHHVSVGESWKATIETFVDLTGARFLNTVGFQGYGEAAFLITLLGGNGYQAGNINFAIWAIFTQSMIGNSGWTTGAQNFQTMAQQWFSANCSATTNTCKNIDLSQFEIITPQGSSLASPQEYITMVPEPASLFLVGIGAIFITVCLRKLLP